MGHNSQPPGFCFHPTDEVLFNHYLKPKVHGRSQPCSVISEADPYKYAPWDLPVMSCLKGKKLEGYFFSPKKGEYRNGSMKFRTTKAAYWKVTGRRTISSSSEVLGIKKTLVFYRRHREKTDWLMHEYILYDCNHSNSNPVQQSYVLCKVFQKNISKRCKHCCASSSQVDKTESPDGEHGEMASLNIQNITQATNEVNIIPDGMLLGQGSVLNEVLALDSVVLDNDKLQVFLMTHIGDSDDPKLGNEENGPMTQPVLANQGIKHHFH